MGEVTAPGSGVGDAAAVLSHADVVAGLVKRGTRGDIAVQYADAFCEYRDAMANIRANGTIVAHPRTLAPIENPYLAVRDRALKTLQRMRSVRAEFLWIK